MILVNKSEVAEGSEYKYGNHAMRDFNSEGNTISELSLSRWKNLPDLLSSKLQYEPSEFYQSGI